MPYAVFPSYTGLPLSPVVLRWASSAISLQYAPPRTYVLYTLWQSNFEFFPLRQRNELAVAVLQLETSRRFVSFVVLFPAEKSSVSA